MNTKLRSVVLAGLVTVALGVAQGRSVRVTDPELLPGQRENKWVCFVAAVATGEACFTLNAALCAFGIMWMHDNCS